MSHKMLSIIELYNWQMHKSSMTPWAKVEVWPFSKSLHILLRRPDIIDLAFIRLAAASPQAQTASLERSATIFSLFTSLRLGTGHASS
jgi:hypothetical protein